MKWLSDLSLRRALALALTWPALVIGVALFTVALWFARAGNERAIGFDFETAGHFPAWLAAVIGVSLLLLGPPLLFLALWRIARN